MKMTRELFLPPLDVAFMIADAIHDLFEDFEGEML